MVGSISRWGRWSAVAVVVALAPGGACANDGDATAEDSSPPSWWTGRGQHEEVDRSAEQNRLDAARRRWDASGVEDYEWTYEVLAFLHRGPTAVRVEGGEVV